MTKTAVALVGLETIQDKNGNPKFSVTFLNNMETWKKENSEYNLKILDARSYKDLDEPMVGIWDDLKAIKQIDLLIYSGHSDDTTLYMISRYRKELLYDQRFINYNTSWDGIDFSDKAKVILLGCQTCGIDGVRLDDCIAQDIANKTNRPVFGYVSKSYQKEKPKGVFHQISDDKIGLVKCEKKTGV